MCHCLRSYLKAFLCVLTFAVLSVIIFSTEYGIRFDRLQHMLKWKPVLPPVLTNFSQQILPKFTPIDRFVTSGQLLNNSYYFDTIFNKNRSYLFDVESQLSDPVRRAKLRINYVNNFCDSAASDYLTLPKKKVIVPLEDFGYFDCIIPKTGSCIIYVIAEEKH